MAEEENKKKVKKPTAVKRIIQSNKRRLQNKALKAQVRTSLNSFDSALKEKESKENVQSKLNSLFSLVDKGLKKGVYSKNKVARIKSKISSAVSNI